MNLPPEAIDEYRRIYLEEVGEEISSQEAIEQAMNLINFYRVIYRPMFKDRASAAESYGINKKKRY